MGPAAIGRLRGRAWAWLSLYLALAGGLLALAGALLVHYQDDLRAAALAYLLPESWRFAARVLIEQLLAHQARQVLVNAAISGALVLVAVTLFPVKERLSAAFEGDAGLTGRPVHEFPLWYQALEELKLVIFYVTVQMSIFWIGYPPGVGRRRVAIALSYGFLFATWAIDFIAPVLQRHRIRYSAILKTLVRRPLASAPFGALFASPPVLAAAWLGGRPDAGLGLYVALIFGSTVICIVWACVAGTWVGARLLDDAERVPATPIAGRATAWTVLLAVFGANVWAFGAVGVSLHHKSQLLKCRYSVDPTTIGLRRPSLGALLGGAVDVGVRFDVTISNPTPFDVEIEDNRLEIRHRGAPVAETKLSPVRVPAGQEVRAHVRFRARLRAEALLQGRALLGDGWTMTLFIAVARGFELPIYLVTAE